MQGVSRSVGWSKSRFTNHKSKVECEMFKKILFPLAVFMCLAVSLRADTYTAFFTEERYQQYLLDTIGDRYDIEALEFVANEMSEKLNGVMLVAVRDTVLLEYAYGELRLTGEPPRRDVAEDNRITETTLFDLASISKQFTAAAVLQLCAQGKLDLNDTITHYFPNLPYSGVTIRHLLTHTSGLPEYFDFKYTVYGSSAFVDNKQLIRVLEQQKYAKKFATGTKFEYVNTNYAILAALVTKVTGVPFEEYVHEHIFKPAGMTHSFYVAQRSKHPECSIASGHYSNGAPLPLYYLDGSIGDKGMYSNVNDLFLWKKALFDDFKIVPEKWVEAAILPENILKNGKFPEDLYGYGFHLEDNPSYGMLVYHGGLWRGFHHVMLYYPNEDIFVVFLSNYCNRAHRGKNMEVLRVLCGA